MCMEHFAKVAAAVKHLFFDVAPRLSRREQDVILHELITETPVPSPERSEQLASKAGSTAPKKRATGKPA